MCSGGPRALTLDVSTGDTSWICLCVWQNSVVATRCPIIRAYNVLARPEIEPLDGPDGSVPNTATAAPTAAAAAAPTVDRQQRQRRTLPRAGRGRGVVVEASAIDAEMTAGRSVVVLVEESPTDGRTSVGLSGRRVRAASTDSSSVDEEIVAAARAAARGDGHASDDDEHAGDGGGAGVTGVAGARAGGAVSELGVQGRGTWHMPDDDGRGGGGGAAAEQRAAEESLIQRLADELGWVTDRDLETTARHAAQRRRNTRGMEVSDATLQRSRSRSPPIARRTVRALRPAPQLQPYSAGSRRIQRLQQKTQRVLSRNTSAASAASVPSPEDAADLERLAEIGGLQPAEPVHESNATASAASASPAPTSATPASGRNIPPRVDQYVDAQAVDADLYELLLIGLRD